MNLLNKQKKNKQVFYKKHYFTMNNLVKQKQNNNNNYNYNDKKYFFMAEL